MQIKIKMDNSWRALIGQLHNASQSMPKTMQEVVGTEGEELRREIVKGIRDQAPGGKPFLPLSKLTLLTRQFKRFRGKKILTVTGQLIAGIRSNVSGGKAFVGVPTGIKRTERGQELWRIADVQENGAIVVMRRTPRMMRFLMALLRKGNLGRYSKARSKRTGRFLKSRWQPKGAGRVRHVTGKRKGRGSGGVIVIKIPARPYIAPAVKKYQASKTKMAQRVLAAMERKIAGNLGRGTPKR